MAVIVAMVLELTGLPINRQFHLRRTQALGALGRLLARVCTTESLTLSTMSILVVSAGAVLLPITQLALLNALAAGGTLELVGLAEEVLHVEKLVARRQQQLFFAVFLNHYYLSGR